MPITTIADMQIVPDKFNAYTIQKTTEKSTLVKSGITVEDPDISNLITATPEGGNLIQLPFYKPLTGEAEVFGEEDVEVDSIETDKSYAILQIRQHAWGDTDLSRVLGGSDPMAAVSSLLGDWWNIQEQKIMLSILKGIFGTNGALTNHILDVSGEAGTDGIINVDNTLDAKNLMGDAADKLGIIYMHSGTFTRLQKQQNIETVFDSDLKVKMDYYLGYQVIVDDGMPYDATTKTYTTFLIGKKCIARNDGTPKGLVPTEVDRDSIGSKNYLINRRAFILHPVGISWNPATKLAKMYPNNTELATPENWQLKYEHKRVPIVALKHRVA